MQSRLMRHMETCYLWIQEELRAQPNEKRRKATDVATKHVDANNPDEMYGDHWIDQSNKVSPSCAT